MQPKEGKPGNLVSPAAPDMPEVADEADPGKVEKIKAEQMERKEGKYGSEPVKPHKPPAEDEADEEKTSWIEIQMVGEDDRPIPGEAYRVVLPDGETVAEGTLDDKGFARIEGFEAGACKVSFPKLDREAWEKM